VATIPKLPPGFPVPEGLTFTGQEAAGPSTIVSGYWDGDLDSAFSAFKGAFDSGGYQVTSSEKEERDAEVNFSGGDSTGQVKLEESCEGRADVRITIRPG
jgi:hypothetical protein